MPDRSMTMARAEALLAEVQAKTGEDLATLERERRGEPLPELAGAGAFHRLTDTTLAEIRGLSAQELATLALLCRSPEWTVQCPRVVLVVMGELAGTMAFELLRRQALQPSEA